MGEKTRCRKECTIWSNLIKQIIHTKKVCLEEYMWWQMGRQNIEWLFKHGGEGYEGHILPWSEMGKGRGPRQERMKEVQVPALWCRRLSRHLRGWHTILEHHFPVSTALLLIQLPAYAPATAEDGPITWAPVTYMGDLKGVSVSSLCLAYPKLS